VIKLDPKNANRGTDTGRRMVRQSIEDYGAGRSVLLDQDDTVIAGNKTVEAAQEMGIPIRVVETDGTELLAVKRTDIDLDTPRGRELAIADNRAAETGLDWDTDVLLGLQDKGTDLSLFWGDDEINTWKPQEIPEAPGADIDQAEALREKWQTAPGQLWKIGDHRLLCGDCTVEADVARLMDGGPVDLMLTDPPYGIGETVSKKNNYNQYDDTKAGLIKLIKYFFPIGKKYVERTIITPGTMNKYLYPAPSWTMAWFSPAGLGLGPWGFVCWHPILCYGKDPKLQTGAGSFPDAIVHNPTPLEISEKNGHPCPKPINFWVWLLDRASRPEGDVFDPFLGSGTTMVACEQLARMCYGIEIDPAYVAVTLERMSKMDITPELIDGQT